MSTPATPKVPAAPPPSFIVDSVLHVATYEGPLWRVFPTTGPHPQVWDELRHYGPVEDMRFDPQAPPPAFDPNAGVMYTSTLPHTALGEVYQSTRVIDRASRGATIASWIPSRPLQLLDLTTNWPVLNGAAAAMMMDDKQHTQAWARAIDQQLGADVDGLYHQSAINNEPMVTLFSRTERVAAFPTRVSFMALLSDTASDEIVRKATKKLGYESK